MAIDVTVILNGTDYSRHVMSLSRRKSLKDPCQQATIIFSAGVSPAVFSPNMDTLIYERGTLVLTGYTDKAASTTPEFTTSLTIRDTYKRALDWFLVGENKTSGSETGSSLVGALCNECGLGYSVDTTSGSVIIPKDIPIGQKFVADILVEVCGYMGAQMRVDSSGILHFITLDRPTIPDWTPAYERASVSLSDASTRNIVRVWGSGGIRVTQSVDAGLPTPPDRIMVYANPNIDTLARANTIAAAALEQFGSIEILGTAGVIPDPAMDVGSSGSITGLQHNVMDTVTDLEFESSRSGYAAVMTLGRRALRFPTFPVTQPTSGSFTWSFAWETSSGSVPGYAIDVITDGTYTYVVGARQFFKGSPLQKWRIEKRLSSSGSLIWATDEGTGWFSGQQAGSCYVDGGYLYVVGSYRQSLFLSDNVKKIDVSSGSVVASNSAGFSFIGSADYHSNIYASGSYLWVGYGGTIYKVLTSTLAVDSHAIPPQAYTSGPVFGGFVPSGSKLYMSGQDGIEGYLWEVDQSTLATTLNPNYAPTPRPTWYNTSYESAERAPQEALFVTSGYVIALDYGPTPSSSVTLAAWPISNPGFPASWRATVSPAALPLLTYDGVNALLYFDYTGIGGHMTVVKRGTRDGALTGRTYISNPVGAIIFNRFRAANANLWMFAGSKDGYFSSFTVVPA